MARPEDVEAARVFMETGVCSCGYPQDEHGENFEEVRDSALSCALTKGEVYKWHQIPAQPQ